MILIVTAIPWRTAGKYGQRGWRHLYWDAGTLLANLLAVTGANGAPAHIMLGFVDPACVNSSGSTALPSFRWPR